MTERPFDAVRRVLQDISQETEDMGDSPADPSTTLDPNRAARSGVPELIYAQSKSAAEVVSSLRVLAHANGRAIATRCQEEIVQSVRAAFAGDQAFEVLPVAGNAIVVTRKGLEPPRHGGRVGIVTAGSSDASVAAEAALIASEMGCEVIEVRDVGVAGLHRLVRPLEQLMQRGVDVIVVVAGMDGALPSVVTGLVPVPVIGLPTSTGYGYGGEGIGALMAMLQSCAPGLVVVNIDNGVGAGATAALIANRVAVARAGAV